MDLKAQIYRNLYNVCIYLNLLLFDDAHFILLNVNVKAIIFISDHQINSRIKSIICFICCFFRFLSVATEMTDNAQQSVSGQKVGARIEAG